MTDAKQSDSTPRQARRDKNRDKLIEATLDTIAQDGFSGTSVSAVIARANLSRGMIHLHFGGKDNLIAEAARCASEAYFTGLETALSQGSKSPQDQIAAIVNNDLSEDVLNERTVRILYAFRGEAHSRPGVSRYSDTRDSRLKGLMYTSFEAIAKPLDPSNAPIISKDATHGTLALLEGMWTDFLLHPRSFKRTSAKRIVFRFLQGLFPTCFSEHGPKNLKK